MKWVGIFQVGIFWVGIFWGGIFLEPNFSFNTFLMSISGLPFVFKKSEFYFQYVNWTAARGCEKAAKKDIIILCYES